MRVRRSFAPLALAALVLVGAAGLSACTPHQAVVDAAREQIGMPYVTGGESPAEGAFDCSGLTYYAWKQAGVTLPRSSIAQWAWVQKIKKADLQPGDLVFYSSGGPTGTVSHVALYAGDDRTDCDAFAGLRRLVAAGELDACVCVGVISEEMPPELEREADVLVDGPAGVRELLNALAAAD